MPNPSAFSLRAVRLMAFALLIIALPAPESAHAQSILGRIVDAQDASGVAGVDVVVRDSAGQRTYRAVTDEAGRFEIAVGSPGRYIVSTTRLGYESLSATPVTVAPGRDREVTFTIAADAIALEEVRAVAKARDPYLARKGFYRRMERGWGRYMGREEVARYPSVWPTHVLRSMGLTIRAGNVRGCRVLIDRMELRDNWDLRLDDLVDKDRIVAIEVYKGTMTPVELRGYDSSCVVAIWTTWGRGGS